MEISAIPEAEREASEVLHSLLPVERIDGKEDNETIRKIENTYDDFDYLDDEALSRRKVNEQSTNLVVKQQDDEFGEIVDVEFSDTDVSDGEKLIPKFEFVNSQQQEDGGTDSGLNQQQPQRKSNKKSTRTKIRDDSKALDFREVAPTKLESSVTEVSKRLASGCECQGVCFKGLQAESVYRHRLNIAELTKQEHDMYLMGVTMAVLSNRSETNRHKERIRQRAVYVFQGKRVCLDAFIYLENVTQYHLKRIRRHVMINGVTPRVHGNVRKKPHNALSLDAYKFVENFVKSELSNYTNDVNKSIIVVNEPRINIYQKFRMNCPGKTMSYSTFRHFLKKQFPYVRFVINRPMDATKLLKQEKKPTKIKFGMNREAVTSVTATATSSNATNVKQMYNIQTVNDTHLDSIDNLDETETEICVEFIGHEDDSYESDGNEFHNDKSPDIKPNEYQDVDFLESEDE